MIAVVLGEMQYPHTWNDLMTDVDAAVEAGEPRSEALAWAQEQYDSFAAQANDEIHGPAEAVFDVQGRL